MTRDNIEALWRQVGKNWLRTLEIGQSLWWIDGLSEEFQFRANIVLFSIYVSKSCYKALFISSILQPITPILWCSIDCIDLTLISIGLKFNSDSIQSQCWMIKKVLIPNVLLHWPLDVRFDTTRCPLWHNPVSALTQPGVRFDATRCPLWHNPVSALTQLGVRFDATWCPLCD